jgi:hypothetical protein
MAHNHEAGGIDVGEDKPHNLNLDETEVFHRAHLLVPPEYRVPQGWHFSNAVYALPPLPVGAELHAIIGKLWARMTL